jgi:hypothetical protein
MQGEVPGGTTGTTPAAAYTVCDFIHPRIDVEAQYALYGLLNRGPAGRAAALSMLGAVRRGDTMPNGPDVLWGIFQENQQVPAMRTRNSGGWWNLIPKGVDAVCGVGSPPIIAFRRSIAKNHFALGSALLSVWPTCTRGTVPPPPPKGTVCTRPPPPPPPVKVEVPPTDQPAIDLNPPLGMGFEVEQGSTTRLSNTFRLRNSGKGRLVWQANTTQPWIVDVSPSFGTATSGSSPDTVTVTVDPTGLAPGAYTGRVVISSPNAANSPQSLEVRLSVGPQQPVGQCGAGMRQVRSGAVHGGRERTLNFQGGQVVIVHLSSVLPANVNVTFAPFGRNPVTRSEFVVAGRPRAVEFSIGGTRPIGWSIRIEAPTEGSLVNYFVCSDWATGDAPDQR